MNRYFKVVLETVLSVVVFLLIVLFGSMFYEKLHYIFDSVTLLYVSFLYIASELCFKSEQKAILLKGSLLFAFVNYIFIEEAEVLWKVYFSLLPFIYSIVVLILIKLADRKRRIK